VNKDSTIAAPKALSTPALSGPTVLELYAGLGGLSAAWPEANVIAAIDIDRDARQVYQQNFSSPYHTLEIESVSDDLWSRFLADVWWMSPPCLPFTRRGQVRDDIDPRNRSLLRLIEVVATVRPPIVVIENVPGFESSRTCKILEDRWRSAGYETRWRMLCPTELGWPNRRRRVYLIASTRPILAWQPLPRYELDLRQIIARHAKIDSQELVELGVTDPKMLQKRAWMSRVDLSRTGQVTACFGSSYGRLLLGTGSYVVDGDQVRRFSPREVALLLGFPAEFKLDAQRTSRTLWRLLGNSLSLVAVRYILSHLPSGPDVFLQHITGALAALDTGNDSRHR
jgi:site-specific DNA-cytosine methylase